VTRHERLLVLASERTIPELDAAIWTATGSEPCTATIGGATRRWIDRMVSAAELDVSGTDSSYHALRTDDGEGQLWISVYDLAGDVRHVN